MNNAGRRALHRKPVRVSEHSGEDPVLNRCIRRLVFETLGPRVRDAIDLDAMSRARQRLR